VKAARGMLVAAGCMLWAACTYDYGSLSVAPGGSDAGPRDAATSESGGDGAGTTDGSQQDGNLQDAEADSSGNDALSDSSQADSSQDSSPADAPAEGSPDASEGGPPPACAPTCPNGNVCGTGGDCASQVCTGGTCQPPACSPTCPSGNPCGANTDCAAHKCNPSHTCK
jgi:hypothetical protein